MKFLNKYERDFLVCSDCTYFKPEEVLDFNYPEIMKGKCVKHNKTVDNRWETKCKDNTHYCSCNMCKYFEENTFYHLDDEDDFPYECSYKNIPVEEDDNVCEFFEED